MKKFDLATVVSVIGITGVLAFAGCGGGGGGGGGPSKQVTQIYLYGTMSSNSKIATVTTSLTVPAFSDYSAYPTKTSKNLFNLRPGVLVAAGPVQASSVSGTFDNTVSGNNKLTLYINNLAFDNMSSSTGRNSGKGTLIGTLITAPGTITTLPTADITPIIGVQRGGNITYLNGCKVNFAP